MIPAGTRVTVAPGAILGTLHGGRPKCLRGLDSTTTGTVDRDRLNRHGEVRVRLDKGGRRWIDPLYLTTTD